MKKKLLFVCFMLACTAMPAQYVKMSVGGGLSSHYGGSTRNIGAFRIGAGYELEFGRSWSVEPGLYYFAKGWKDKNRTVIMYDEKGNIQYDQNGNVMTGVMNVTSNTNYIELPVVLNYYLRLADEHYLVFTGGPYVAYGVGGKAKTSGDTQQTGAARYYYSHNTFDQDNMHRFDGGMTAGISYEFNRQFDAGLVADFGLLNVSKQGAKNISYLVTFAYRLGM